MPKCHKCGSIISQDDARCPSCGAPKTNQLVSEENDNGMGNKTIRRTEKPIYGVLNLEDLPVGHIVDERYEIKGKLGQGGFGTVYRAYDQRMETEKALKVIPSAITNDQEAMEDLRSEAKTMIALNHPNIVRVYDFHDKGNLKYIDMEYVEGKTLAEKKLEYHDKQMPEEEVHDLALMIADGMAYAHSQGVIHKDVKPQNIMVTSEGDVKIMDFGIAEKLRMSMSRVVHTSSSGTLLYMSPEQVRGKEVGKEADIYSFGAVLYELLSGHPPFYRGGQEAVTHQIFHESPQKLGGVSTQFNDIIQRCLAKEYSDRYKSFEDLLRNLKPKEVLLKGIRLPTFQIRNVASYLGKVSWKKFALYCVGIFGLLVMLRFSAYLANADDWVFKDSDIEWNYIGFIKGLDYANFISFKSWLPWPIFDFSPVEDWVMFFRIIAIVVMWLYYIIWGIIAVIINLIPILIFLIGNLGIAIYDAILFIIFLIVNFGIICADFFLMLYYCIIYLITRVDYVLYFSPGMRLIPAWIIFSLLLGLGVGSILEAKRLGRHYLLPALIYSVLALSLLGVSAYRSDKNVTAHISQRSRRANTATLIKNGNFRSRPSPNSTVIDVIRTGQVVEVLASQGNYYVVRYNNTRGYLHKALVRLNK